MNDRADEILRNLLPIAIAVAVILGFVLIQASIARRALARYAEILSDAEITGAFNVRIQGRFHERAAKLWLVPRSRYRSRVFHFSLDTSATIPFGVQPRGIVSSIAKSLRLGNHFEVGMTELDSRYAFASSEAERFTRWLVSSSDARTTLQRILDERGVTKLTLRNGTLRAEIERYSDEQASVESVGAVLELMSGLGRAAESA